MIGQFVILALVAGSIGIWFREDFSLLVKCLLQFLILFGILIVADDTWGSHDSPPDINS